MSAHIALTLYMQLSCPLSIPCPIINLHMHSAAVQMRRQGTSCHRDVMVALKLLGSIQDTIVNKGTGTVAQFV